jgi:hypothetical protein
MKYLAMILLAVISGNAMASSSNSATSEWIKVDNNVNATGYANPSTIRRIGNIVKMSQLVDFKTATRYANVAPFMSDESQEEYDCKEKQSRTLVYSLHSENMGKGAVVFSDSNPSKWETVQPGSKRDEFLDIACGKK